MNPISVLSLFDGMACGYEALKRAGIPVSCYGASEIDPYAMKIALKNHPDIVHIGSIENWRNWGFSAGDFDLIIGGSPCQGFSGAGEGLNFSDPRSKLYFEFEEIIKTLKPKWWLLENVRMKKQWADIITQRLGVQPVLINSALVSAQNRERLYWANFPIKQPEDRGILLKDIILHQNDQFTMIQGNRAVWWEKNKEFQLKKAYSALDPKKAICMMARQYASWNGNFITVKPNEIRQLHPIECERLQTLPDNYTEGVSNTQRYKMIGNGWTVEVIKEIFQGITNE